MKRDTRIRRLAARLLRDQTAIARLEYAVAGVSLALATFVASRVVVGALVSIIHRVYLLVTLPLF